MNEFGRTRTRDLGPPTREDWPNGSAMLTVGGTCTLIHRFEDDGLTVAWTHGRFPGGADSPEWVEVIW